MFLPRFWKPSSRIISWSSSSSVRSTSSDLIHCASSSSSASEYMWIGSWRVIQGRGPTRWSGAGGPPGARDKAAWYGVGKPVGGSPAPEVGSRGGGGWRLGVLVG